MVPTAYARPPHAANRMALVEPHAAASRAVPDVVGVVLIVGLD